MTHDQTSLAKDPSNSYKDQGTILSYYYYVLGTLNVNEWSLTQQQELSRADTEIYNHDKRSLIGGSPKITLLL